METRSSSADCFRSALVARDVAGERTPLHHDRFGSSSMGARNAYASAKITLASACQSTTKEISKKAKQKQTRNAEITQIAPAVSECLRIRYVHALHECVSYVAECTHHATEHIDHIVMPQVYSRQRHPHGVKAKAHAVRVEPCEQRAHHRPANVQRWPAAKDQCGGAIQACV